MYGRSMLAAVEHPHPTARTRPLLRIWTDRLAVAGQVRNKYVQIRPNGSNSRYPYLYAMPLPVKVFYHPYLVVAFYLNCPPQCRIIIDDGSVLLATPYPFPLPILFAIAERFSPLGSLIWRARSDTAHYYAPAPSPSPHNTYGNPAPLSYAPWCGPPPNRR